MRQKTARQTRERIFEACQSILQTQGAKMLTLDAVARAAQLSKGGLLYHFATKEALVKALFEHQVELFEQQLEHLSREEGSQTGSWLSAYAEASIREIIDPGKAKFLASLFAAGEAFPWVHEVMRERYQQWQDRVETCGIDPTLATLIRLAVDGLWFSEMYRYAPPDQEQREKLYGLMLELIRQARI